MREAPEIVYVIEDDTSLLRAMRRLLRANQIWTVELTNMTELRECLPLAPKSCLLVDLILRKESGLQASEILKTHGETAPIIFISATEDEAILAEAERLSTRTCLRKPIDAEDLFSALSLAMECSRPEGSSLETLQRQRAPEKLTSTGERVEIK